MARIIRLTERDLTRIVKRVIENQNDLTGGGGTENRYNKLSLSGISKIWKQEGWGNGKRFGTWKIENGKLYCKVPVSSRIFPWWKTWSEVTCIGADDLFENISFNQKIRNHLKEEEESTSVVNTISIKDFVDNIESKQKNLTGVWKIENDKFYVRLNNEDKSNFQFKSWVELTC
jgi:hypothetical protein